MAFLLNEWFKILDPVPWTTRSLPRCTSDGTYIYMTGGYDTYGVYTRRHDVWRSRDGISWTRLTDSPGWAQRSGHGFVYLNGKFYIMGGDNIPDGDMNDVWSSEDGVNWTNLGNAPWTARHEFSAVVFDNKIWVIGGYSSPNFLNDVWSSPDGINWTQHTDLPTATREHVSASFLGRLWVFGGNNGGSYLNSIYSTEDGVAWTSHGNAAWSGRREHQIIKSDDETQLAIVGGYDGGSSLSDVWQTTDGINWTQITQSIAYGARSDFGLASVAGRTFIVCGSTGSPPIPLGDVWTSDIERLANFTADDTDVMTGDTVTFTDESTDDPVGWLWDFGDGNTSTEQNPTHNYNRSGTYSVSLTVTYDDDETKSRTRADYITVEQGDISFTGTPTSGVSPLDVDFQHSGLDEPVRWLWDFGDGGKSSDGTPRHTYYIPGLFTVTLTMWDEYGNEYEFSRTDYISVSGNNLQLVSTNTDFCFRHGVRAKQGQGIMPVNGTWVWPPLIAATAKGRNTSNETISLVINADDMRLYRIGVPELWTDQTGAYSQSEIECEAMFPEIKSRNGEHENVRHVETHVSMRPFDERDYRGKAGYDSEGFRDGHELSIEAYKGGEQVVPETKLSSVYRNGDYALLKEVEGPRMQIKLKYSTSAFRTTRIESHCQEIDHRTPPQLNNVPEKVWQKSMAQPDLWLTRKTAGTNRADGVVWDTGFIYAAGPDGGGSSAFVSTGADGELDYTDGDFTLSFWAIGDCVAFVGEVQSGGSVTISIVDGNLVITDPANSITHELVPSTTWRFVTIVRSGNVLNVYEAGVLKAEYTVTVNEYGGDVTVCNGSFFDFRRFSDAKTVEAIYNYYESVLDGGGGYLP